MRDRRIRPGQQIGSGFADGQTGEVDRFAGAVPMCSGYHAADPNGDYIQILNEEYNEA